MLDEIVAAAGGALAGGGSTSGTLSGAGSAINNEVYNRQLSPVERQWTKDHAKDFAAYYERKMGRAITLEEAQRRLLATGYTIVDKSMSGSGAYDLVAGQYINERGNGLFRAATAADYANPFLNGNPDHSPTPEQEAAAGVSGPLWARVAVVGMSAGLGAGLGVVAVAAPEALPAIGEGLATGARVVAAAAPGVAASPAGVGAISAGINAGSQYIQKGEVNPVDVGGAFVTGYLGSYGGFFWNVGVNAAGGVATTAVNNVIQGKNDSLVDAGIYTGLLGGLGYGAAKAGGFVVSSAMRPGINSTNWSATGVWASSGWNLFNPNRVDVISGTALGALGQETVSGSYNYIKENNKK